MVTVTKTTGDTSLSHVAASGEHTAHVKGAPNYIMEKCTSYMAADGSIVDFDEAAKAEFTAKVDELSSQALRVLAIATKDLGAKLPYGEEEETDAKFDKIVNGLTLCGLCASIDPERDGVKDSVLQSRQAGVRVVMITGDYLKTAIAIAKNINILNRHTFTEGNGEATDCGALRPHKEGEYLSNPEIDALTKTTSVFARAKPEDKLEIVKSLQRQGFVCAMTGDGVNDAPALKQAHIGVAMGITGTEVSKEASDMVLLDDNFATIVNAVEEGRLVYANIRRFVKYILGSNVGELLTIAAAPLLGLVGVPMTPLQILWMNLVTDGFPALALALEPGESDLMQRPPAQPGESIFARGIGSYIIRIGLVFASFSITLMLWVAHSGGPWKTMVFTTLCLAQMGHALAARSDRPLLQVPAFSNPWLLVAVVVTSALQMALLYIPPLSKFFGTEPMSLLNLAICVGVSLLFFVYLELENIWRLNCRNAKAHS